jgi:hypothetical protein
MIKYMRKLGYQVSEVEMPSIKLPKGRLRYLSTEEEQRLLRAADPTREIKYVAPYDTRRTDIKNQMQDFYDLQILLLDSSMRFTARFAIPASSTFSGSPSHRSSGDALVGTAFWLMFISNNKNNYQLHYLNHYNIDNETVDLTCHLFSTTRV